MVHINRITRVPWANEEQNNDVTYETPAAHCEQQSREPRKNRREENAVERIVSHRKSKNGIRYRVQWYGFDNTDDTYNPALRILTHFIHRYWTRAAKKKNNCKSSRRTYRSSQKSGRELTKKGEQDNTRNGSTHQWNNKAMANKDTVWGCTTSPGIAQAPNISSNSPSLSPHGAEE